MSRSPDRGTAATPPGWRHCIACGASLADDEAERRDPYCVACTEPGGRPS